MKKFKGNNIRDEKADGKGMIDGNAMIKYLQKAKNAICEINLQNGFGSGFFCKIPYTEDNNHFIPVLVTCNHVLTADLIKQNNIKIIVDGIIKKLSLDKRKIWTDKKIDFTCIEIKEKEDNIHTFFNLDDNVLENNCSNDCYLNQNVVIYAINKYENVNQFAFSNGEIISFQEYNFAYNCNSLPGCSGGCIVNQYNNCVIGIHKGEIENKNNKVINAGIFIKDVVKYIKESKSINVN